MRERLWRPYREEQPPQRRATGLTEADILAFRSNLSALRFKLALLKLKLKALHPSNYNPEQPRVPAGNPDGGQWTDDGGTGARLAAADKPRLGAATIAAVAVRVAKRIIDAYRAENGLFDLFGHKDGTVAYATFDGKDIFGSNSTSPTYTSSDDAAARAMRDTLIEKYPDVMNTEEVGRNAECCSISRGSDDSVESGKRKWWYARRPYAGSICRQSNVQQLRSHPAPYWLGARRSDRDIRRT